MSKGKLVSLHELNMSDLLTVEGAHANLTDQELIDADASSCNVSSTRLDLTQGLKFYCAWHLKLQLVYVTNKHIIKSAPLVDTYLMKFMLINLKKSPMFSSPHV